MHTSWFRIASAMLLIAAGLSGQARAQSFSEGFDDISTLAGNGWAMQNNSSPLGTTGWLQGSSTVFSAYDGAANAYIAANFSNTAGSGTISNWLMTPRRTFSNGDVLSFFTMKPVANPTDYPDRLQVRLSTNGASTDVGTNASALGDFTTLLLDINPTLTAGGYPTAWTQYTITISGLPAPTSGRAAFRYFVTGGGPLGTNSDYIGIDRVVYTPYTCPSLTITPGSGALPGGTWGTAYSTTLSQTGALGSPNYALIAGALPSGLTMAASGSLSGTPTVTGTFSFTVQVMDNSGCSGSASYSITVVPSVPGAPQNVNAVPANAQASVTWEAPDRDGADAITGYTVTAVQDVTKGCTTTGALTCTVAGLANGTAYSFNVVARNGVGDSVAAQSNTVTPTLPTVSGTVPGMTGTATATLTGGGTGCTFDPSSAFATPSSVPTNRTLPFGGFAFLATGCSGSVTIAIAYPDPLPAGVQFWKYGPATAGAPTSSWFQWNGATLSPDRRTVTYSIVDNGIGDADPATGSIRDPLAPAVGSDPVNVPVDNPWALAMLAVVLGGLARRSQRRKPAV